MPFDPVGFFQALMSGISKLPSSIVAAVLLGGPTTIWLVYRFSRPLDPPKLDETVEEDLHWVCASCRSMNEDRLDRCYSCHEIRPPESIPVVIRSERESGSRIGIVVLPAVPASAEPLPGNASLGPELAGAPRPPGDQLAPGDVIVPDDPPAALEPLILASRVKASARASASVPTAPRRRRKPQLAGDASTKRNPRRPAS